MKDWKKGKLYRTVSIKIGERFDGIGMQSARVKASVLGWRQRRVIMMMDSPKESVISSLFWGYSKIYRFLDFLLFFFRRPLFVNVAVLSVPPGPA
jgi:hypothetical protein